MSSSSTAVDVPPSSSLVTASRPPWLDKTLYPFASHVVDLDEHRIHYIDEGQGPTLLFLHANPLWSFQYRNIIRELRTRFRCIAPDYPGFGLSAAARGYQNTLTGNARLVERFIHALSLTDITLVVHDSSVAIGLGVVTRHPAWFRALVISNGFAWPLDDFPGIYRFLKIASSPIVRFLIVNFNLLTRFTVRSIAHGGLSQAERRAYLGPFIERGRRHHQHDMFRSIVQSRDYLVDLQERLLELPALPVLLVFADNDPTYKAGFLSRSEQLFPQHRSVLIAGSDHFPQEHAPEQMAEAIGEWWDNEVGKGRSWAGTYG